MPSKMDSAWRAIINDPDKLDGIVSSMSRCMARMLSINDPDIARGKLTLGQALYSEKEHFPSRKQLDEVENIHRAMAFVYRAQRAANDLRICADRQTNVLLTAFKNVETFSNCWHFTRPKPESSKLKVGGIRRCIKHDVKTHVHKWLLECDAAMMIAFRDVERTNADEEQMLTLVQELAESIASRLTLSPEADDDQLSTESLTSRATQEVAANTVLHEESQRTDMEALSAFLVLARAGPRSEEGRMVLQDRRNLIHFVVRKPPVELGLRGVNAQHMNLALLARACAPEMDFQLRIELVHQWHERHGAFAAAAAVQAIQKLQLWSSKSSWEQPFIKVVYSPEETPLPGSVEMPRMPFMHSAIAWRFVPSSNQAGRSPFDWQQRRCVRMTSLVLQLLGHGGLERGVVCSSIVGPVATQAMFESRIVLDLLRHKLDAYSLGTKLLRFCENVSDKESHLDNVVSEATVHVSNFSLLELYSIFSPQSPALRSIMGEFTRRTRDHLTFSLPPQYVAFAYDAMAILLPIIRNRREHAGISWLRASNPLYDLLNMVPRVRTWTPLEGSLRLELDDLKDMPKTTRILLEELSKRSLLVEYKRSYLGNQRYSAKKAFVFDSAQLVAVLSGYPLVASVHE